MVKKTFYFGIFPELEGKFRGFPHVSWSIFSISWWYFPPGLVLQTRKPRLREVPLLRRSLGVAQLGGQTARVLLRQFPEGLPKDGLADVPNVERWDLTMC